MKINRKIIFILILLLLIGVSFSLFSKNSELFKGQMGYSPVGGIIKTEKLAIAPAKLPNLLGKTVISKDQNGKWRGAEGGSDECEIWDMEITDPETGEKRVITISTCPLKCCSDGKQMKSIADATQEGDITEEQSRAIQEKTVTNAGEGGQQNIEGLYICDPNKTDEKIRGLLGGISAESGGETALTPKNVGSSSKADSRRMSGGGSGTEQADALAKRAIAKYKAGIAERRMNAIRNHPTRQSATADAKKSVGQLNQFEKLQSKRYGKNWGDKMNEEDKKQHSYLKQVAKDANEVNDQNKVLYDQAKEDRDKAREDEEKATNDFIDAGGDEEDLDEQDEEMEEDDQETQCAPDDDDCFGQEGLEALQRGLDLINQFLIANGIAPIELNDLNKLHEEGTPIDWQINPRPGDIDGGAPAQEIDDSLCKFQNMAADSGAIRPMEDQEIDCNMGCEMEDVQVGNCQEQEEGEDSGQSQNPDAQCAGSSGPTQEGAIDCPQDNPNCGSPAGGGDGGGVPGGGGGWY